MTGGDRISTRIGDWLEGEGDKTLGGLIETFGGKSFAVLFVFLLGVPALPLPTGGATHVFEIIAMLLALQLIAGRQEVWLPARWRRLEMGGPRQRRFVGGLVKLIGTLERFTQPRLRRLFGHRLSNAGFGLCVLLLSLGAFVAPPFSGLDTLPALGVVLVSLAVLLEDFAIVVAGLALGTGGVVLEYALGRAAFSGLSSLL
ncbi:MAG TPA: exopolysaccharide biosynthesis protein [Solirubrobacteraceae bacterium]|nr:exopolysaccharide biosynthesis protein [Solirubrobacteraceae bacterium]